MKYSAYKSNRNTGLTWVPTAPAHWEIKRLRFMLDTINPTGAEIRLADDAEVSFIPMNAVGELGELDLSLTKHLDEIGSGYTYIREGDVVAAKITPCFENGKGAVAEGLTNGVAFGTTELHVLRNGPEMNNRFLFFLTASSLFRHLGEGEMYGAGGQKRVPEDFIKDLILPYPPMDEQHAIVEFLNEQTSRIDALLVRQQRLLRLLNEKRRALITQAVTQGLNMDAPRRPSGVAWLGEIPTHWQSKSLKFTVQLVGERVDATLSDLPFVGLEHIEPWTGRRFYDNASASESVVSRFKTGDVLFGKLRPYLAKVHLAEEDGICTGELLVLRVESELIPSYLRYFLASPDFISNINSSSYGSKMPRANWEFIGHQLQLLPPLSEQQAIVEFLNKQTARIDVLKDQQLRTIAKLQEYRAALITAAVTGQIDVRADVTAEAV